MAKPSRDPTHTARLRQVFRGEAQRRIRTLLTATREMLVEQNAIGSLTHPMMMVAFFRQSLPTEMSTQLEVFTSWFNTAIYQTVVQKGDWLRVHALRAWAHGLKEGEKWTKSPLMAQPDELFFKFYTNELEGIADATVQQVTRAISAGLLNREGGSTLYRRVVAVTMKVTDPRLRGLGHQIIVQMHNKGIAAQLKSVGVTHVDVIPETILPRKLRDEMAYVQTAEDDDVCDECQDYSEGGPYQIDSIEIPLHMNCRCAIVPVEGEEFTREEIEEIEELAERKQEEAEEAFQERERRRR
jgi:hypothetical protein